VFSAFHRSGEITGIFHDTIMHGLIISKIMFLRLLHDIDAQEMLNLHFILYVLYFDVQYRSKVLQHYMRVK